VRLPVLSQSLLLILALPAVALATSRDGRLVDTGLTMDAPASRASDETADLTALLGEYDVHLSWFVADSLANETDAVASVHFMNRGHGLLERFHCADFDGQGHELSTLSFLMHQPSTGKWLYGIADSYRENVQKFDGSHPDGAWTFEDVLRPRGGSNLVRYRIRISDVGADTFRMESDYAVDGKQWQRDWVREYRRRDSLPEELKTRDDFGQPAEDLPPEARQFDFIVGDWDNQNEMLRPKGKVLRFPTREVAVYAMNGHAVLEYIWNDLDPNVPDAATTILRIYNRGMRRWESMYSSNRGNGILYFGGVQEGDKIILHPFDADSSQSPISYWTFHDMHENDYGWYGNTSRDRGKSFVKTWKIQATRR
jgi:hypothetical protein